ncbi:MAG TPA: hypothetical protein VGI27_01440 [Solirubrobacteraceae bacterium]
MSHRPLATVTGLTIGDYLLWNWSLNANHDVLALVSGLTLPPLTIAFLWLVALTIARLLARTSRSSRGRAGAGAAKRMPDTTPDARPTPTSPSPTPASTSRKIAA